MHSDVAASAPEFSLIVTTKGRVVELAKLLQSLERQLPESFEVILSDQNEDDRLLPLLDCHRERLQIVHVRSEGGASRGRNAGLARARGRLIAFPDDDCWYPDGLLAKVRGLFEAHPEWDMMCGRSLGDDMRPTQGRWVAEPTSVCRSNALQMSIEYTMFCRAPAVAAAGGFDETLGVGAGTRWGAGEGTDFLLSALGSGSAIMYTPDIQVHHPEKFADYSRPSRDRQSGYARGIGYVLHKHKFSLAEAFSTIIRPLGGAVLFLARGQTARSLYHLRVFASRSLGWCGR